MTEDSVHENLSEIDNLTLISLLKSNNEDTVEEAYAELANRSNDTEDKLTKYLITILDDIFASLISKQTSHGYESPSYHDEMPFFHFFEDSFYDIINVICGEIYIKETTIQASELHSKITTIWNYNFGEGDEDKDYWQRWVDCYCPPLELAHGLIKLEKRFLNSSDIQRLICHDAYNWLSRYIKPETTSDDDEDMHIYGGFITLIGEFGSLDDEDIVSYKDLLITFLESENYEIIDDVAGALEDLGMSEEELEGLGYEY